MLTDIAYAMAPAPDAGGQPGAAGGLMQFFPLILIFVIFYFLIIRPQQKRAKEQREMLANLKKGDKIVTAGGVHGLVDSLSDKTVTVKIAENVKVKLDRASVARLRTGAGED